MLDMDDGACILAKNVSCGLEASSHATPRLPQAGIFFMHMKFLGQSSHLDNGTLEGHMKAKSVCGVTGKLPGICP